MTPAIRRWLAAAAALGFLAVTVAGTRFYVNHRQPPGGCVTGRWKKPCIEVVRSLSAGRVDGMACVLRDAARPVAYRSDGLRIAADLYAPAGDGARPAIVLLHGSSPYGRRLPVVRVLGNRLRDAGYLVLAPDARGFGDSDDPPDLSTPGSFDFARDVRAAIDFLLATTPADRERLYLLGHSFGGGVVLAAHDDEPRARKLVLLGPGRRLTERILADGAPDREEYLQRARWVMDLPGLTYDVWSRVLPRLAIENYVDEIATRPHPPILLIDGAAEDSADLAFLRAIHRRLPATVDYWTIPGADHYLQTGLVAHRPCYRRAMVDDFVRDLDAWLRR